MMMRGRSTVLSVAAVLGILLAGLPQAARAQTKIHSGQCCPVKIKKSGSYVLTGSLQPGNKNANAIEVTASNVSIDLNGFSIIGPGVTGSGTGIGIDASGQDQVSIQNGSVSAMAASGIVVGNYGVVRNVRSIGNGTSGSGAGIQCTGTSCLFENCVASGNGSPGLVFLDTSSGYQNDVAVGNTSGQVLLGTSMGSNVCGSGLCP